MMKTTKMKTMKTKKMESIPMKMTKMLKVIPTNRTVMPMIAKTNRHRRLRINRIKNRVPLPRKHRQSLSCKSASQTMMMKMSGTTATSLNRRRALK